MARVTWLEPQLYADCGDYYEVEYTKTSGSEIVTTQDEFYDIPVEACDIVEVVVTPISITNSRGGIQETQLTIDACKYNNAVENSCWQA